MAIRDWKKILIAAGVIAAALIFTGFEVFSEDERVSVFEFLLDTIEKALIIIGAGGVFVLLKNSRQQEKERLSLYKELEIARLEGDSWRRNAQSFMNGVGAEIEKQFATWGLSEAESEVGLFMIKGLSHKEIADLRGTAGATVRQQARSVYQKSGLPGKASFSAYFLEDLLPPAEKLM